ncbi:MAG: CapA family protein [Lachnospiraceae bacterium]|nr:CapA family protein [Lachnospiraceae bacterium]
MKKIINVLLIAYLAVVLAACGADDLQGMLQGGESREEKLQDSEPADASLQPAPAMDVPAPKAMIEVETTVSEDEAEEDKPVTIIFAGDMNFDRHYANMNALLGRGGEIADGLDGDIMYALRTADIAMINNEFPYSDRGSPTPGKKFTFRADPSTVHYLNDMGVDIVGLANNHAYDYGPDALLDTLDTLSGANIRYVGAGRNIEEAMTPQYIEAGGMTIAFTAATQIERSLPPDTREATETDPGVLRTLDPSKYVEVIKEADANADFTIAFVHWGSENVFEYEAAQKELAEAYAEAGADLIIGAHPHVLQGFEYIGDVPVVYSMGNFWFNSKTLDSCMIEATLYKGELTQLRFIPCVQKGSYTTMQHEGDGEFERIIEDEAGRSAPGVSISSNGVITKCP